MSACGDGSDDLLFVDGLVGQLTTVGESHVLQAPVALALIRSEVRRAPAYRCPGSTAPPRRRSNGFRC